MMVSDVRGDPGSRSYLVSDPWSGKTDWISERELAISGTSWVENHFGFHKDQLSHFYTGSELQTPEK